jgi:predicted alpha-1,2-mannosidase
MKTLSKIFLAGTLLTAFACNNPSATNQPDALQPVDYVNPYMGTISHMLVPTFPTVHLPHSMMRVIPQRREAKEVTVEGLPVILTSHRGTSAFSISPYQGEETGLQPVIVYSYDHEQVRPYSYSTYLDEYGIRADLAVAHQSAAYRIAFPDKATSYLVFNTQRGRLNWDGTAISGFQTLGNGTTVYLYLVPDVQPEKVAALKKGTLHPETEAAGNNAALVMEFGASAGEVELRYGISFIDEAQAKANMVREVEDRTIEDLWTDGRRIWNEELGKISVTGDSEDEKTVFYTSLYRTYERPVSLSEEGRYYSPFDQSVHDDQGRSFYIDDWIWDSYRAHHPLRTIIDVQREEDILHSFILMAEQMDHFWMPTFPRITGDSRSMNSNHGVATFLDAHVKGLKNFDLEKAYLSGKLAVTEKTLAPWSGKPAGELDRFYYEHGYIPALYPGEEETIPEVHHFESRQPVAVTLGTAYDEWCLARLAQELDKPEEAGRFMKGAFNYRNLYNPETGFFHPKDAQGNFIQPFDYRFSGGQGARGYYDENNGWTYRWDVQHNIPDLIDLMGGNEAFVNNLDATFREPLGRSKYEFYAQLPDQTGNVGQFSMANEPSLHIPYLYNYAGQPWKTQKMIHKLVNDWFRNDLMGVPGDEDGGGMSAFVVFSMMGFYPVTPGLPEYAIGSPFFEKITIRLENGNTFVVSARNFSQDNKSIQSATLNGSPHDQPRITHEVIMQGGTLELEMGEHANKSWGVTE